MGGEGKSFSSEVIKSPQIKSALSFAFCSCSWVLFSFCFVSFWFCFSVPKAFFLSSRVLLVFPFMVLAFGVLFRKIFSTPKIKQTFTTHIFYFALWCEARIARTFPNWVIGHLQVGY